MSSTEHLIRNAWVDTTNLTATTRYYPVENNNLGCLLDQAAEVRVSFDVSGGVTLTAQYLGQVCCRSVSGNVPDSADWVDVTAIGRPVNGGAGAASYVDTKNTIVWVLPPGRFRIVCVTADASNAVQILGTVQAVPQANANVAITSSVLPSDAATSALQTDLNTAVGTMADAKVDTDAVGTLSSKLRGMVSRLAELVGLSGSIYHSTTPSKANAATGQIEVDKRGIQNANACARHWRRIALTSGLAADGSSLGEGACDAIESDTDNVVVYAQPPERALIANQDGTTWTCGAGWSYDAGTHLFTHAAGGGANDLEITTAGDNAILVGGTYACLYYVTITAGTSVTMKLGTGAGTVKGATGQEVKLITSAVNTKIIFTPTNDLACTIDARTIFVIPGSPTMFAGVSKPISAVKIVGVASAATPATAHATAKVFAHWLRRSGAVEVV